MDNVYFTPPDLVGNAGFGGAPAGGLRSVVRFPSGVSGERILVSFSGFNNL